MYIDDLYEFCVFLIPFGLPPWFNQLLAGNGFNSIQFSKRKKEKTASHYTLLFFYSRNRLCFGMANKKR